MSIRTRFTALLVAFFLMFSNIGLALNVHFCGDTKVASQVVYSQTADEPCSHEKTNHNHHSEEDCTAEKFCCGSSDNHSDCCSDEYITQGNPDVVIVNTVTFAVDVFVITDNTYSFEFTEYSEDIKQEYFEYSYNSNAPPLYKLHCSLIYYA